MRIMQVVKHHEPENPIPLIGKKGEVIEGQERETEWTGWLWCRNTDGIHAWVPKSYLEPQNDSGQFRFLQDYSSKELTVEEGQKVIVMFEEASWGWVRTSFGEEGWIPLENLDGLKGSPSSIHDLMEL